MNELALCSAISSRICHDLISPVAAISNGMDLINELQAVDCKAELEMVHNSSERAAALLELYRFAFGAAHAESTPVARQFLKNIITQTLQGKRFAFLFKIPDGPELTRVDARLCVLLAIAAPALVGRCGQAMLSIQGLEALPLSLTIREFKASPDPQLIALLSGAEIPDDYDYAPREVEFVLAAMAAKARGTKIMVEHNAEEITISIPAQAA